MNKAVYTAIIGPYEELKPVVPSAGWDYYCFTDQPLTSDVWKIIPIEADIPAQRMARKIKLLPHVYLPDYQFSFWIDASFQIKCNINDFWNKHFKSPLTAPAHPLRNDVYAEIRNCIVHKRGDEAELTAQRDAYKKRGVKEFACNIITSGVLMRENNELCRAFCDRWWNELSRHSTRDQVAFAGISRGFPFTTFRWDYTNNREFIYKRHFHLRH